MCRRYDQLTWPEVEEALGNRWLIIPVGSLEQHGPHLPLAVDSLLAERISNTLAESIDAVVAPVLSYGARSLPTSGGGPTYPGTIYLAGDVLLLVYFEVLRSFMRCGAKKIFVLNAHWENEPFLTEAIEKCREIGALHHVSIFAVNWWSLIDEQDMLKIFGAFPGWHAEHAGQAETALMLHYHPELVYMDRAVDYQMELPQGVYRFPIPTDWTGNMGVLSRSRHVTPEMGRSLAQLINERLASLVAAS